MHSEFKIQVSLECLPLSEVCVGLLVKFVANCVTTVDKISFMNKVAK